MSYIYAYKGVNNLKCFCELQANDLYEKKEYTSSIFLYNEAINIYKCSELFLNRAAAYIKRKWHGDLYAALKDSVTALKLEPNHMEAHFQLVVSLFELDKLKDSKMYLDQLTMNYPSYKTSAAYKCLYSDLLNALFNNKDKFDGNFYNSSFVYICIVFYMYYLLFFINCLCSLFRKNIA